MNNVHEFLDRLLLFGDVIVPLALFPLDEECLCVLPTDPAAGEDVELELKGVLPLTPFVVGPDPTVELVPFVLVAALTPLAEDLLLGGIEEDGGVCKGLESGWPAVGCLSAVVFLELMFVL